MKKIIMKLTAVALCLCLALCFVACRETEDADDSSSQKSSNTSSTASETKPASIVGEWSASVDLTDLLKQDEDMGKYVGDEKFEMVLYFKLNDDGTANMTFDTVQLSMSARKLIDVMMRNSMEEALKEQGGNLEAVLEYYDCTYEELVEMSTGKTYEETLNEGVEAMLSELGDEDMKIGGKYLFENGNLYLYDEGEKVDKEEYIKCTVTEQNLTFVEFVTDGENDDEEMIATFKGLVFERVK